MNDILVVCLSDVIVRGWTIVLNISELQSLFQNIFFIFFWLRTGILTNYWLLFFLSWPSQVLWQGLHSSTCTHKMTSTWRSVYLTYFHSAKHIGIMCCFHPVQIISSNVMTSRSPFSAVNQRYHDIMFDHDIMLTVSPPEIRIGHN